MKRSIVTLLILHLFIITLIPAETKKRPLDHDVYDGWNNIFRHQISPDGQWVSWETNPQTGDGWLHIMEQQTGIIDSTARGTRASFAPGSEYLAFLIKPQRSLIRQIKVANRRGSEMPKETLAIHIFAKDTIIYIDRVKSSTTAGEDSPWLVYHLSADPPSEDKPQGISSATTMVIFNPITGEKFEFPNVTQYSFSYNGRLAAFIEAQKVHVQKEGESPADSTDSQKRPLVDLATVRVFDTHTRTTLITSPFPAGRSSTYLIA